MKNKIHLLLVEDNEGDIILTREALENSLVIETMEISRDGNAAIEYLEYVLFNKEIQLPDIILLDINLPKVNGQEVLQFIKEHEQLKQIPVIMLSTSSSEKDVVTSYKNYANCFISKPVEIDDFMSVISKIEEFWLNTAIIPHSKN
jgi:CheY-like chemotaxis protein